MGRRAHPRLDSYPLGELGRRSDELIREIPVVVVCRSGVRSLTGTDELLARGFADVASLNGGILAWARAGHPISRSEWVRVER